MNYNIPLLPERSIKPRKNGITMVMDKGLGINQATDLITTASNIIDFIKLGFGTSLITNNIESKIALYHSSQINTYIGGTLLEAFLIRKKIDEFLKLVDKFKLNTIEVSDGCININHDIKCEIINKLSKNYIVLSEVGSKDANVHLSTQEWISKMTTEIEAGASYIITESRESGTVGIYDKSGQTETNLINAILSSIAPEKIIWEAPLKSQQIWFIKKLGANVNLGNIPPAEIIPLETLRLGLRGDTFFDFLPEETKYNPIVNI